MKQDPQNGTKRVSVIINNVGMMIEEWIEESVFMILEECKYKSKK